MIDFNKITKIRKEKGLSVLGLCNLIGINRSTLWAWKNRGTLPSEDKIRKTAEILGVSVETISDLKEEKEISDYNLIERSAGIGNYLHGSGSKKVINKFNELHSSISGLENDLSELTIIINALLKSLDILIYVKDKNLKYITASESFLKNLNLNNNYNVTGKIDEDLKKCFTAGYLLYIDAKIKEFSKSVDAPLIYYKSLELLLICFNELNRETDEQLIPVINEIMVFITKQKIKLSVRMHKNLICFYEYTQNYAKAENHLFFYLEEEFTQVSVNFGKDFYNRLLMKNDAELEKGNLSRDEIMEGIKELNNIIERNSINVSSIY